MLQRNSKEDVQIIDSVTFDSVTFDDGVIDIFCYNFGTLVTTSTGIYVIENSITSLIMEYNTSNPIVRFAPFLDDAWILFRDGTVYFYQSKHKTATKIYFGDNIYVTKLVENKGHCFFLTDSNQLMSYNISKHVIEEVITVYKLCSDHYEYINVGDILSELKQVVYAFDHYLLLCNDNSIYCFGKKTVRKNTLVQLRLNLNESDQKYFDSNKIKKIVPYSNYLFIITDIRTYFIDEKVFDIYSIKISQYAEIYSICDVFDAGYEGIFKYDWNKLAFINHSIYSINKLLNIGNNIAILDNDGYIRPIENDVILEPIEYSIENPVVY